MLVKNLFDNDTYLNDFTSKTNEELAVLAKSDKYAAAVLISRFYKIVSVKAAMYANSAAESDDLRQEGLLSLLLAIGSFDVTRGTKFATFAEICIQNKMKTVVARSSKKSLNSESINELSDSEIISDEKTPESIYLYKEFISELWKSISESLTKMELQAFRLHVRGLNYSAAAERLGISEKSVDNAVQRARKKIRSIIYKLNMAV